MKMLDRGVSSPETSSSILVPTTPAPSATPGMSDLPSLHPAKITTARRHADVSRVVTGGDLRSVRDRALLALGIGGAFRRSELVALRLADIERVPEGLRVTIRRSKTDQDGASIAIPEGCRLRPSAPLDAWIERGGIPDGFLVRRLTARLEGLTIRSPTPDRAVARLVQVRVAQAGHVAAGIARHSLPAGFLTAAARSGASVFKMREVSRHRPLQVLADCARDAEPFRAHAGEGFP